MRIIDDDEVGLKEKPFDSEMRSKALGVCGSYNYFVSHFYAGGGGGGNNIYNVEGVWEN